MSEEIIYGIEVVDPQLLVCDCFITIREIVNEEFDCDDTDLLPYHICPATGILAAIEWARSHVPKHSSYDARTACIRLDDGRFVHFDESEPHDPPKVVDPGSLHPVGQVVGAIRQWIEVPADERDNEFVLLRHNLMSRLPFELQMEQRRHAYMAKQIDGYEDVPHVEVIERFRQTLAAMGYPSTPGTARYLFRKVKSQIPPAGRADGPTRGCLITSLAIAPFESAVDEEDFQPIRQSYGYVIRRVADWTTCTVDRTLRDKVNRAQAAHTDLLVGLLNVFDAPVFSDNMQAGGRPRKMDDLEADLSAMSRGEIQRDEVYTRAYKREIGDSFNSDPDKMRGIRKKVDARIRRREAKK